MKDKLWKLIGLFLLVIALGTVSVWATPSTHSAVHFDGEVLDQIQIKRIPSPIDGSEQEVPDILLPGQTMEYWVEATSVVDASTQVRTWEAFTEVGGVGKTDTCFCQVQDDDQGIGIQIMELNTDESVIQFLGGAISFSSAKGPQFFAPRQDRYYRITIAIGEDVVAGRAQFDARLVRP